MLSHADTEIVTGVVLKILNATADATRRMVYKNRLSFNFVTVTIC